MCVFTNARETNVSSRSFRETTSRCRDEQPPQLLAFPSFRGTSAGDVTRQTTPRPAPRAMSSAPRDRSPSRRRRFLSSTLLAALALLLVLPEAAGQTPRKAATTLPLRVARPASGAHPDRADEPSSLARHEWKWKDHHEAEREEEEEEGATTTTTTTRTTTDTATDQLALLRQPSPAAAAASTDQLALPRQPSPAAAAASTDQLVLPRQPSPAAAAATTDQLALPRQPSPAAAAASRTPKTPKIPT